MKGRHSLVFRVEAYRRYVVHIAVARLTLLQNLEVASESADVKKF